MITHDNSLKITRTLLDELLFVFTNLYTSISFQPQKLQPQESRGQSARDYNFHGGDTSEGRPVYYVVEEPDSLHSDRSPYDFEPADTHTSLSSHVADYTQSGLTQA